MIWLITKGVDQRIGGLDVYIVSPGRVTDSRDLSKIKPFKKERLMRHLKRK